MTSRSWGERGVAQRVTNCTDRLRECVKKRGSKNPIKISVTSFMDGPSGWPTAPRSSSSSPTSTSNSRTIASELNQRVGIERRSIIFVVRGHVHMTSAVRGELKLDSRKGGCVDLVLWISPNCGQELSKILVILRTSYIHCPLCCSRGT